MQLALQPAFASTNNSNSASTRNGFFSRCAQLISSSLGFGRARVQTQPQATANAPAGDNTLSTAKASPSQQSFIVSTTAPQLSTLNRFEYLAISSEEAEFLKPVLEAYAIQSRQNFFSVIEEFYKKLVIIEDKHQLEKSEQMARFAQEILSTLPNGTAPEKRELIQYHLGVAIMNLELMPTQLWVENPKSLLSRNKNESISIGPLQFAEWTQAYIKKSALYTNSNQSFGDVLDANLIRDLFAHNHWPITAKKHDSRHIHFAVGNPLGAALVLKSSRTLNLKRHVLISMLFEGVERFQFRSEFALTKLMYERGYNLTTGLLYVATATETQLDELISTSSLIAGEIAKREDIYQKFKPSLLGSWTAEYISDFGLERELDQMVEKHLNFKNEPENIWFLNYAINPEMTGAEENDLTIHH